MTTLATGIITAPRPRPTLSESVTSYHDAGFHHTHTIVFADGNAPISPALEVNRVVHNKGTLGNLRNWTLALRTLLDITDARWLMVCEDDITWAHGSHDALTRDLSLLRSSSAFSRIGGMSLYCPINMSKDLEKNTRGPLTEGWHSTVRKGMKTWGAQCLLFSREQALALVQDSQFNSFIINPKWTKNVDAIVATSINDRNLSIAYRIPCLVDHSLGDANSSLGYKDDRPNLRTAYFTGQA